MSAVTSAPAPSQMSAERRPLQGSHIWYELMTTDPDAAARFYGAVTGWSIGARIPGEQDYRMIERSDGGFAGGVLGLKPEHLDHGARPAWLGYVGADDVDALVARIGAKGGTVLMPAFDIPQGRIAMVADPQGNPFYVMKPVPPAGRPDATSDVFSPDADQRVGWNELSTPDPATARQFYGELFDWKSDDFMPMGEHGEYRFFDHDGLRIGAVYKPQDEGFAGKKPAGWRYYIRVRSITVSAEAVNAHGGTILMGPHEVPSGDHIIVGHDPQGAEFALVGKA